MDVEAKNKHKNKGCVSSHIIKKLPLLVCGIWRHWLSFMQFSEVCACFLKVLQCTVCSTEIPHKKKIYQGSSLIRANVSSGFPDSRTLN